MIEHTPIDTATILSYARATEPLAVHRPLPAADPQPQYQIIWPNADPQPQLAPQPETDASAEFALNNLADGTKVVLSLMLLGALAASAGYVYEQSLRIKSEKLTNTLFWSGWGLAAAGVATALFEMWK